MYRYDDFILVVSTWVQQSKSVRTRGSKLHRKTSLQNCQILENLLRNIKIFPSWNPNFLARNPIFLNGFLTFFNGFLLSSTAFCFLQRLSNFPWRLSAFQEIRENLSTAASIKDHYSSFVFPTTCSPSFVIPATMSTSSQQNRLSFSSHLKCRQEATH